MILCIREAKETDTVQYKLNTQKKSVKSAKSASKISISVSLYRYNLTRSKNGILYDGSSTKTDYDADGTDFTDKKSRRTSNIQRLKNSSRKDAETQNLENCFEL